MYNGRAVIVSERLQMPTNVLKRRDEQQIRETEFTKKNVRQCGECKKLTGAVDVSAPPAFNKSCSSESVS